MAGHTHLEFFKFLKSLGQKEYLLSVIAYGSAPTILSGKPSTLLNFTRYPNNLYGIWHEYKWEVCKILRLQFIELKDMKKSICVLFYNRSLLEACIFKRQNQLFLKDMGYSGAVTVNDYLVILKKRFEIQCPHEIGIFLGFPVDDVKGFIANKGQNSLFCRYWKVYSNIGEALLTFAAYDNARKSMVDMLIREKGQISLEKSTKTHFLSNILD